jgi:AcrR family transcriptional regulator
MARTGKAKFTADDWLLPAIEAMASGGVRAVNVEALAKQIGASKGSFYWFFANREALVTAALTRWLEVGTDRVAAAVADLPDPAAKLRALAEVAFAGGPGRGIEIALQADVDSPEVRRVLAEAHRRRLAILRGLFVQAGHAEEAAQRAALSMYATYLGFLQLRRADPDSVPDGADRDRFLDSLGLS